MTSHDELRSARFRREREASWRRLEALLPSQGGSLDKLTPPERRELPSLYRSALSSLSVARATTLDDSLIKYLETLASRAYIAIYAPRKPLSEILSGLVQKELPCVVRGSWGLMSIATLAICLGMVVGWLLVTAHPESFFGIVPAGLVEGRSPFASTKMLLDSLYYDAQANDPRLKAFAMSLYVNNASVAILAFALGFALGVPTVCLLFYNGAMLGAFVAVYAGRDLGVDFIAWLAVHGTTEMGAVILAGAAGLALGNAVLFPTDRQSRLASLLVNGRRATILAVGALGMLVVAAVLEGIVRQSLNDRSLRLGLGGAIAMAWCAYFALAGRRPT